MLSLEKISATIFRRVMGLGSGCRDLRDALGFAACEGNAEKMALFSFALVGYYKESVGSGRDARREHGKVSRCDWFGLSAGEGLVVDLVVVIAIGDVVDAAAVGCPV